MVNNKKKILLLATRGEVGGVQVFMLNLALDLVRRGFPVSFAFGDGAYLKKECIKHALPYFELRHLRRTHNPFKNILFIFELRRLLNKEKFDVLHINSSNALAGVLSARYSRPRTKSVFTVHGLSLIDEEYKKNIFFKILYTTYFKLLLKFTDETVYISQENQAAIGRQNIGPPGNVILNGLDPKSLKYLGRDEARAFITSISGIRFEDSFVLGSIGRLSYQKNYEFLLGAFPKVLQANHRAIAIIIGEGPFKKRLKSLAEKLNLSDKVFFIGELIDAAQYLRAFDLFILPSRYEGLPITLIECLFTPLPVLAANVGGNSEVLNAAPGQLYKLNDVEGFLAKLKNLMSNKALRNDLAQKNRAHSRAFHLSRMTEEYIKLYNN